jgi:hypothetical protein
MTKHEAYYITIFQNISLGRNKGSFSKTGNKLLLARLVELSQHILLRENDTIFEFS